MTAPDASNPIEAVRARLDGGRKWHKGYYDNGRDAVCLLGAVDSLRLRDARGLSDFLYDEDRGLLSVVREQFPERWTDSTSVVDFNDDPRTTWADVDLVLDKAARRWDEQVDR